MADIFQDPSGFLQPRELWTCMQRHTQITCHSLTPLTRCVCFCNSKCHREMRTCFSYTVPDVDFLIILFINLSYHCFLFLWSHDPVSSLKGNPLAASPWHLRLAGITALVLHGRNEVSHGYLSTNTEHRDSWWSQDHCCGEEEVCRVCLQLTTCYFTSQMRIRGTAWDFNSPLQTACNSTYELFISGIFHLIFLDRTWSWGNWQRDRDKRGLPQFSSPDESLAFGFLRGFLLEPLY